jgi:DNA-binding MarR family transcriptional regulator
MRVRMLNRIVTNAYDEFLRPHGLGPAQMNILVAVSLMGQAAPSDLEQRLFLEKSTLSRNIDRMRRRGWLRVVPGEDARGHRVELTTQGMTLIRAAYPSWVQAQAKVASLLGEEGVGAVTRLEQALVPRRKGQKR